MEVKIVFKIHINEEAQNLLCIIVSDPQLRLGLNFPFFCLKQELFQLPFVNSQS